MCIIPGPSVSFVSFVHRDSYAHQRHSETQRAHSAGLWCSGFTLEIYKERPIARYHIYHREGPVQFRLDLRIVR